MKAWKPLKAKTTWSRTNYIVSKHTLTMNSRVLSNKSAAAQTQRLKSTIGTVFRTSVNWCFVAKAQWNKLTVKQPVRVPPDSTNTTNPPELKLYFQEHNALKAIVLGIIVDEKDILRELFKKMLFWSVSWLVDKYKCPTYRVFFLLALP